MWKLRSTKKEHWDQFLFVGEDCIVGRKDSTLLISDDPSVSRKHSVLTVKHQEENLGYPARKSSLFLRDEGSKYGTFKNGVRITSEELVSDGDIIKFGQFESEFRIHYEPLVVTTSCLDVASKYKLKKSILKLGGHLVSEWQPACTHLVMSSVKVTIKALCCLVSLKSIVLPEYFEELQKMLKSSASVVPPIEFMPPIGESLIDKDEVSFDVNPQRRNLFKNKNFFFLDDKQFKKLHLGIIMGGGKATILAEDKMDLDLLLDENSCFIEPVKTQLVNERSKNFLTEIISNFQKKNLRMIPESDVGLAVVYASTEKFCNPSFNVGSIVLGSQTIPSQTLSEREVYVPDTQDSIQRPKSSARKSFLSSPSGEPKSKRQKLEVSNSLNLTSFREDPEDVFEIPLSAQVKQELDNIFDVPMNNVKETAHDKEEIPSTLPAEPLPEPKIQVKHSRYKRNETKEIVPEKEKPEIQVKHSNSERNEIEEIVPKKKPSPKKPRIEKFTTLVNGNGFTTSDKFSPKEAKIEKCASLVNGNGFMTSNMNGEEETNLPRNLAAVKFVSLIVKKPLLHAVQLGSNSTVKNFKKFKKVLHRKAQALPVIIGGHDLVPYDRNAVKLAEQNWDEEREVVNKREIKGAFDWDSQNM